MIDVFVYIIVAMIVAVFAIVPIAGIAIVGFGIAYVCAVIWQTIRGIFS